MEKNPNRVEVTTESVEIFVNGNSLLYWDIQEIREDATVAFSIANAINVFYTQGPEAFKNALVRRGYVF